MKRWRNAWAVLLRIYLLSGRSWWRTLEALAEKDANGTALDYLWYGQTGTAYLLAIRYLRPPEPGPMLVGSHPIDPRRRTVDPFGEG